MLQLFIIVYIISFNTLVYKKKINAINIIISIWFIFSILSMFGLYDMYLPNELTYRYILTFLVCIEIFAFIFYKIKYKIKLDKSKDENINWNSINIIMFLCVLIMLYFSLKGIRVYLNQGSFSSIRNAYLNYEFISNKMQMLLSILVIPLGTSIGIYSILDYINNRKIRLSLIFYLLFLVVVLTTGGRNKVVFFALLIVIALFDKYKNNIFVLVKKNIKIVIFLIIIFLIVLVITFQRNLSGGGFFYNIYAYFAGSIHLLGVYLSNSSKYLINSGDFLKGQVLISGFAYPITFIMRLFGIDIKAGIYIVNEVTQEFIAISDKTMINNNVTCIYSALRDFGEIGLVIYPMIIAFFLINLYKKKEKSHNLYNESMYYYFLVNAIFLLFDFNFSNPSTIFTFIFLVFINKILIKRNKV